MLSGCMYQSVDTGDITNSIIACKEHNGVNRINEWWTGGASSVCND